MDSSNQTEAPVLPAELVRAAPRPEPAAPTASEEAETSSWTGGWQAESNQSADDAETIDRPANGVAEPDDAVPVVDGEAAEPDGENETDSAGAVARSARTRSREERSADRARKRQQAAEDAIDESGEANPAIGPIVRHLNTVTKEMALAYRTIGVLTAERDSLRRQVYELQGLPLPEDESPRKSGSRAETKDARAEARSTKQAERAGIDPPLSEEETAEKLRSMVLRRRLIALGVVATLAVVFIIGKLNNYDWSSFGRESLAGIAFVGPLFQVFLIGFVFYRVARVSSKAGKWLFPGDELPKKRRR